MTNKHENANMNDESPTILDSNSSDSSDESSSPRPNRWKGPSSTWGTLTAQERGLAASLDQIQNQDLSIHLYNAHALKRRAREYARNPEEVKKQYPAIPDEDQTFKPPKSWTAWPLPPDQVPREREQVGPEDGDERHTFKRRQMERGSRELEDVLLGVTLKFAKERFMRREQEDEVKYLDRRKRSTEDVSSEEEDDSSVQDWERSDEEEDVVEKESSDAPPSKERLIPVVSADDERSRGILRPSIRHTLAKLDEVLIALHHARKTCRRFSHSSTSANSDNEAETDGEDSVSPSKRGRGRPRKFADLPDRSRAQSIPEEQGQEEEHDPNSPDLFRGKTTHRGRPLKAYERLEGENQEEYLVRIAKTQKKPLPAFAPLAEIKPSKSSTPSPEKSRKSAKPRTASEELDRQRRMRLNTRDWSEVLSSAALVGFPPDAIARATQRCANLFGEGMTMRTIFETPYIEKGADTVAKYTPEEIPDFDDEEVESSSEEEDSSEQSTDDPPIKTDRPDSRTLRIALVPPSKQTCFCPMPGCPRRIHGFRDSNALKSHLRLGHKIAKDEVEDYLLPSDEEMDGAVHVDGFLKPLKILGGARGSYKKAAKRTRVEGSSEKEGSGDEGHGTRDPTPG
ncbi:uncharacterized protein PAC_06033 [Phialocephala subalpina]|uniref:Rrn9 domain-containing protein n=1 Tax=Phialocephala subalpina TaxID=576137 RepID=A0A1L7WTM4_9HELO|nr:uncharacterized protein PAC_06033 [Phialocephala subalpina]